MKASRQPITYPADRRAWARQHLAGVADRPTYGSAEWAGLTDDDPRKLAAAIVAAECWASDLDNLPIRLRIELEAAHKAEEARWAEWFGIARQAAHNAATPGSFTLRAHYAKTPAERVAQARQPRSTDRYPRPQTESGEHAA